MLLMQKKVINYSHKTKGAFTLNNGLEMSCRYNWKFLNFWHYLGISLEKLRKIIETHTQYSRCSSRDLNPESSKNGTRMRQQMSESLRQLFVNFRFCLTVDTGWRKGLSKWPLCEEVLRHSVYRNTRTFI